MPFTLIRHKVKDYLQWKFVFVEHARTRKATGSQGGMLFQNAENPNEIFLLMEWDDFEKAREFAGSADLREAMERAGVADKPESTFCRRSKRPPGERASAVRSRWRALRTKLTRRPGVARAASAISSERAGTGRSGSCLIRP